MDKMQINAIKAYLGFFLINQNNFYRKNYIVTSESTDHKSYHDKRGSTQNCRQFIATQIQFSTLQTLVLILMFSKLISICNKDVYMSVISRKDKCT